MALGIFSAFFFDAFAIIVEIRLAAQQRLPQILQIGSQLGDFRVRYSGISGHALGFRSFVEPAGLVAIDFHIKILIEHDVPLFCRVRLNFAQRFAEELGDVRDRGHSALIVYARGTENAQRALHEIVSHVRRADEREIFAALGNLFYSNLHVHWLGSFDARVQHGYQTMLLFDGFEQVAQLRLAGEVNSAHHLRGAFDVNLTREIVAEDGRIAQRQRALHQAFVALPFVGQLLQQILANRLQHPAGVMTIQEVRGGVQLRLREVAAGTQDFVARVAAGDEHHYDAAVGQKPHPRMVEDGLAHRWRYDDSQAIRDFSQNVSGAFRDFRGTGG